MDGVKMSGQTVTSEQRHIAEAIRLACVRAALEGYERAAQDGLCHAGAWEAAVDAIRALDMDAVLQRLNQTSVQPAH
jgi:hypothetical protein